MAIIGNEITERADGVTGERVEIETVNALPSQSTLYLSPYARAVGKITDIAIDQTPEGEAQKDLAGDAFFNLWQTNPKAADPTPQTRQVNKALLDWARELQSWQPMREAAAGNIPVSMVSAALLWARLTSADALKDALEKQEQAAEAEREAERAEIEAKVSGELADAAEQAGDAQAARARQRAQVRQSAAARARANAEQAAAAAAKAVEHTKQNPMAGAAVAAAVRAAREAGQELAESMSGWGTESGAAVHNDPQSALEFLRRNTGKVMQIVKRAGRVRGIATQTRRGRVTAGNVPTEIAYTRDLTKVTPTELARLHPHMPKDIRALAWGDWIERGLLGWVLKGDAQERGAFVACVDVSGSMSAAREDGETREVAAKGIALGMGQIAASEGRRYALVSFSDERSNPDPKHPEAHTLSVQSGEGWSEHLHWASTRFGGGTDFDTALAATMQLLVGLGEEHCKRADAVFISDGEGGVSDEQAAEWRKFREEHGTRLIYVPVGDCSYGSIEELADVILPVEDLSNKEADQLTVALAKTI